MVINGHKDKEPQIIKCGHGHFTNLDEFAEYVRNQQLMGHLWNIDVIHIGENALVVYSRNKTKMMFDAATGKLISYNDENYEMTEEPKKEVPA